MSMANAATWYVRDGGGTYGSSSSTCNGQTNAIFTGANGPNCALAHPVWITGTNAGQSNPMSLSKWASGDIMDIVGDSDTTWQFTVSGITTAPAIGDTFTNNGYTWTVTVINLSGITNGSGYISASSAVNESPLSSGTLTRTSGSGDSSITFSASAVAQAQFMIGNGMPNSTGGSLGTLCNSFPTSCEMNSIPTGISSTQMTSIIGIGNHKPQLWGTQGLTYILYLVPIVPASTGTLTVVGGHGSGTSPISYTANGQPTYNFTVTGITNAPAVGDQYTTTGTWVVDSVVLSGGAGNIVMHALNGSSEASNPFGTLSVVSGHGSGDASITYTSMQYAWIDFTVSGVTTPPSIGDEYTTGGQTYDVISTNLSSGSGTIQFNAEGDYDVENLDITMHSSCSIISLGSSNPTYNGYPAECSSSTAPYNTWAKWGIYMEGTNFTTKNNWWHNLADSVISFPGNVSNWNSTNDKVDAAGFFLDDTTAQGKGSLMMTFGGNNTMTGDVWAWGGVMEKYPLPDASNFKDTNNYINGCDQNCGGLGGGFMQNTNGQGACGNWTILSSQFLYSLKTNIDFLHCDGTGTFNMYRSRSEGSTGESLKLQVHTVNLEESQFISYADLWKSAAFSATLATYSTANTTWNPIYCRGGANTIFSVTDGMTVNYISDDVAGSCGNIETANNFSPARTCVGDHIYAYNTKFLGGYNNYQSDPANVDWYYDGSNDNGSGNCPSTPLTDDYNSIYYTSTYGGYGCSATHGAHDTCSDPLIAGEISQGAFTNWIGPTAFYGGTNFGDLLYLQSGSPLKGSGTGSATWTNGSTNDYNNFTANSPIDMGAIQYNSCISTTNANGVTTGMCSSSTQCCSSGSCSSSGFCPFSGCTANAGSCSTGVTCCSGYCCSGSCSATSCGGGGPSGTNGSISGMFKCSGMCYL